MLKVQVALAEPAERRMVCGLLEAEPDVVILPGVAPADDATADVLIVDDGGAQRGCALIAAVKRAQPRTRAIMVIKEATADAIRAALTAGASGIVTRDQPPRELLGAIRVVAQGGSYLCPLATSTA